MKKVQKHLAVSTFIVIFAANKRIAASYKHMEALNELPWAAKSPIFKKVSEISDISALSREERIKYDHAIKRYIVIISAFMKMPSKVV